MSVLKWQKLGWDHQQWEIVRYYCSLRGNKSKTFLKELEGEADDPNSWQSLLKIDEEIINSVLTYLKERPNYLKSALTKLRSEDEAVSFCNTNGISFKKTKTQSKDHHQSTKSLVATVTILVLLI